MMFPFVQNRALNGKTANKLLHLLSAVQERKRARESCPAFPNLPQDVARQGKGKGAGDEVEPMPLPLHTLKGLQADLSLVCR